MVICRYYGTPGGCRYGNNCKYEHIDPPNTRGPSNSDPFSSSSGPAKGAARYSKTRILEEIQWPLSAVANKDAPEKGNVIDGDISPDELRLQAYQMVSRGMSAEVQQRESELVAEHHAKIDGLSRSGMDSTPTNNKNNAFQVKDPFAQTGSTPAQQNQGMSFGISFPASNGMQTSPFSQPPASSFSQPQQSFPQQPQPMAQNPSPFSTPNPPAASMLPQSQAFPQQPPPPGHNAAPVANPSHDAQFSAAQFGFAKIPEAAPPPRFY